MSPSSNVESTLPPKIIYEDEDLLVLDKPAGIHSVSQSKSNEESLAMWLVSRNSSLEAIGKNVGDSGLVQRLDFETTGLILTAKSQRIWESLHQLIMLGALEKHYFCLVEGKLKADKIELSSFIGSPYRRGKKVRVYPKMPRKPHRALEAKTTFENLRSNKNVSILRAYAPTARRHQIRAHAASIGHALVGDTLYGSSMSLDGHYSSSFFLQACYLKFQHPTEKSKVLEFELELPTEIQKLITKTVFPAV